MFTLYAFLLEDFSFQIEKLILMVTNIIAYASDQNFDVPMDRVLISTFFPPNKPLQCNHQFFNFNSLGTFRVLHRPMPFPFSELV